MPSRPPLYVCWSGMIQRCENKNNKNYPSYGGRGISVCPRWRSSYEAFFQDMGMPPTPSHSLDRIDNDQGYAKWNCRWATRKEQVENRRNSLKWEWAGEVHSLSTWSELLEVPFDTLEKRLQVHGTLQKTRNSDFHYVGKQTKNNGNPFVVFSLGKQKRFRVGSIHPGEDAWDAIQRHLQE